MRGWGRREFGAILGGIAVKVVADEPAGGCKCGVEMGLGG